MSWPSTVWKMRPLPNVLAIRIGSSRPGAVVGRIGEGRREDGHVRARAAQVRVEFVALVHPDGRQAAGHGVIGHAGPDRVRRPPSVRGARPVGRVLHELVVLVVPVRPGRHRPPAPAADADHLVVGLPARERVVGRVDDDDAAAGRDVLLERRAQRRRPALVRRVVVEDDGLVGARSPDGSPRARRSPPARSRPSPRSGRFPRAPS